MQLRFLILFCLLSLAGCQRGNAVDASIPATEASAPTPDANSFMASSHGINYDHEFGIDYTLRWAGDAKGEAIGSGSVGPFEDSGQNCCISLPRQWHPGLKLKVEWVALDLSTRKSDEWKTENLQTELAVPEYTVPGDLYVLFYPGKQVEILVSAHEPGTPGWLGREKLGPLEACVARHGEKECMKSFPKYPRDSYEARAQRFRESCTEERLAESSNPEGNRLACQEFVKMCKEKWAIKEKKMCELNFKEEE
ncbi:hypothetical protein GCM10007860_33230 [Chitiniphilus shinanonensis]|uniref:Lipoprotein n=2 Tax=Chitiniphilus shinanonensis TaxID=553088 RepID=A0ABQ6BXC5_9NEIS|nr:DUF3304 domain-containing protein [Chitiniphilus shinanonensis]GLS06154.1 hypothetical protein GCM10007860_33230 [Chitiniphilus shinanonensis]